MSLDPALLALLVCPLTRGPLRYDPVAGELISERAGLAYPVRDGVPVLLVEEARPLADAGETPGASSSQVESPDGSENAENK